MWAREKRISIRFHANMTRSIRVASQILNCRIASQNRGPTNFDIHEVEPYFTSSPFHSSRPSLSYPAPPPPEHILIIVNGHGQARGSNILTYGTKLGRCFNFRTSAFLTSSLIITPATSVHSSEMQNLRGCCLAPHLCRATQKRLTCHCTFFGNTV